MKLNTILNQSALAAAILISSMSAHAAQNGLPIVNGQEVLSTDQIAKTTVALVLFAGKDTALCTGSIMDSSHILTAAHCVEGVTKGVVVFRLSLPTDTAPAKEEMRQVTNIVDSADYPGNANINSKQEFHDLAILTFEGGLPAGYEPVKIVNQQQYNQYLKKGSTVTVAGYGVTSGIAREESGTLRKTKLVVKGALPQGVSIVTTGNNTNACSGDSGGPAYVTIAGQLYLWGVLSRGDKTCSQFAVYTKFIKGQDVNGEQAVAAVH